MLLAVRLIIPVFFLPLCGMISLSVYAHEGTHSKIERMSQEIVALRAEQNTDQALLARIYQLRAEEYLQQQRWEPAEKDLDQSRQLDPNNPQLALGQAQLFHARGKEQSALSAIEEYLQHFPADNEALLLWARILQSLGRYRLSADGFDQLIERISHADSSLFLERAEVLQAEGLFERALNGLDQAGHKLGDLLIFESKKVELLLKLGAVDDALLKIDSVLARIPRKERWLLKKAKIQARHKSYHAAEKSYVSVLSALDKLPPRLSRVAAMIQIRTEVEQGLEKLRKQQLNSGIPHGKTLD